MGKHLWEIDHPYYAPDGYSNECESFAELRHSVDRCDEDMNHIYRWDWVDYRESIHDDLFLPGEFRDKQKFTVHMVQPRKSEFINFWCPVTHEEEPEVLEWLRGPRVLGALQKLWEPILGPTAGAVGGLIPVRIQDDLELINDRDRAIDAADKLANALGQLLGVELGEHSNMNDPWQNALTAVDAAIGQPRCQEPTCPDFGDPDFGEATCPAEHADPRPTDSGSNPAGDAS